MKAEIFDDQQINVVQWDDVIDEALEEKQQKIILEKNHRRNQNNKHQNKNDKILLIENDASYMEELSNIISTSGFCVDIMTDFCF